MTTIYLIRHAQAEGNIYRRYQGWYDSLVTGYGLRQIEALAKRFQDIPVDAAWSSDLTRTRITAEAVTSTHSLSLRTDPDLREIGGGIWEDHAWGELRRRDPDFFDRFISADPGWRVDGSESFPEVQARMDRALRRIAAEHEGQTVAVFSHGAAIAAILAKYSGFPPAGIGRMPHGDNTAVSKLLFRGERVEIEFRNNASHLRDLPAPMRRITGDIQRNNLWFRPLDLKREAEFYREARREAWQTIHRVMDGFNAEGFLQAARANGAYDSKSVLAVMREEERVGILQMDLQRDAQAGIGHIPFFYLTPPARMMGLGVQLLGQAVSTCRPLGFSRLRLRCAPENGRARRFYERYGFRQVGEEPGGSGTLDVLEKDITHSD